MGAARQIFCLRTACRYYLTYGRSPIRLSQLYCCVVIPPFDPVTGLLPEGEYVTAWEELVDRFGWTLRRRRLLDGLTEAVEFLAAAGCRRLWLNGSFVTAKDEPGDFDACWDPDGVDLDVLDPIFFDFGSGRATQKARFGGEFFPNVTEVGSGLVFADFFKNERDGRRKGIVVLNIGGKS